MANSDRGNAAFTSSRIPALNAKLHAGHDVNAEYRNQSNLLSSVQYGYGAQGLVGLEVGSAAGSPFAPTNPAPLNLSSTTQSFIGDNNNAFALQLNNSAAITTGSVAAAAASNNDQLLSLVSGNAGLGAVNAAVLPNVNGNLALPREGGVGVPPQTAGTIPNDNGGVPTAHLTNDLAGGMAPVVTTLPAPVLPTTPTTPASGNENPPVAVNPVAQTPTLSAAAASGNEDSAIALNISAALANVDPNENLSVTITGVPNGAALSAGTHNADGSWSLTAAQLSGLTMTPPANFNGTINLDVTATASENGTTASISSTLPVTVNPVAETPTLSVQSAAGNENTAIALHISAALANVDPNESLSLTITGVPVGAVLSAGTHNTDGSWTLTAAQLANLTLTPAENYTGTINLNVAATASENGTSANISAALPVTVDTPGSPPATTVSAPTLQIQGTVGNENTAIAINISAALTDVGSSETLAITITGVPTGATLSAGTNNHDGTWTLAVADLTNLTITPPSYYTGTLHLGVTATASESGMSAAVSAGLNVTVNTVVDAPTLTVQAANGNEDTAIALNISAALTDVGAPETLSVNITGVPAGAVLSAGTHNADGSWSLTAAQLSGLTITPPAHYSGTINLNVTATASENSISATASANLAVTVNQIPHAPTLSVGVDAGFENAPIALNITAALTDNSEALSVVVSGVPAGAVLSAGQNNGNGTWSLAAADLVGLTLTPPRDYSGTLALTVAAVSTDTLGNCATTTSALNVAVAAVADTPTLLVVPAIGTEDSPIALSINSALTNILGSETLSIHISGVPTGAVLSAGTHNSDGSWTLTAAQLSGLSITPPAHNHADFTLIVTATATDNSDSATAAQTVTLPVTVIGIAHVPTIAAGDVSGAAGANINLNISGALSVNAGATESLTYVIHGVPDGFALNHGVNNGDNTWTLSASDLANLQLLTPNSFNGQLTLYATSVAHDSGGAVAVSAADAFQVDIGNYASGLAVNLGLDANVGGIGAGVANAGVGVDLLPASGGLISGAIDMKENTAFALADAPSLLNLPVLNGVTNLISNITISGVPSGASFNHGTNLGGGSWQFSTAQLTGLVLTPPANTDGDFTLNVTAHMLLGLANINLATANVNIYGIASAPTLAATAGAATEEQPIALNIAGALTNTDGTEALTYEVSGMPAGFTLNHGTSNSNGSWSLSAADLSGLEINPAAAFSGNANVTVSAVATETDGNTAVAQQTLNLNVAAIAHAPTIAAVSISGSEDQSTTLNLGITAHASEHISALTISGVPVGATLTYATNNNGVWTVDPAHIADVQLVPPTHWSGDANLTIAATSQVGTTGPAVTATETVPLHIAAVATAPTLAVTDSTGNENAPIALHISAAGLDTGGAENVSVVLSGVPNGGEFSAGTNNGNGTWTVAESALHNLAFTAPHNFSGDVMLTATALATEVSNGATASTHMDMHIHVLPVG